MNGASKLNGGKMLMRAVGMAGKEWATGKHSPLNKPLQADTASGFSARHRPQTHERPTVGRPCSKNNSCRPTSACLSPCSAGRWGECSGTGSHEGGCRPTYTCPYPTYRLCLSLSLPTPLICGTQFSPKLTFFLFLFFYPLLPTINRPLAPFNVFVRLT